MLWHACMYISFLITNFIVYNKDMCNDIPKLGVVTYPAKTERPHNVADTLYLGWGYVTL